MNKKHNAYIPVAEHDPYMSRAAEYCIEMEWNHDAIPELAKTLIQHENYVLGNLDWKHINRHETENQQLRAERKELLDQKYTARLHLEQLLGCIETYIKTDRDSFSAWQAARSELYFAHKNASAFLLPNVEAQR